MKRTTPMVFVALASFWAATASAAESDRGTPVTISVEVKADSAGEKLWIEGQNRAQVDPWRCSGDRLSRVITVGGAKGMSLQAPNKGALLLKFDPVQERFTRILVQNTESTELEEYELQMVCRNGKTIFRVGPLLQLSML